MILDVCYASDSSVSFKPTFVAFASVIDTVALSAVFIAMVERFLVCSAQRIKECRQGG